MNTDVLSFSFSFSLFGKDRGGEEGRVGGSKGVKKSGEEWGSEWGREGCREWFEEEGREGREGDEPKACESPNEWQGTKEHPDSNAARTTSLSSAIPLPLLISFSLPSSMLL